MRRDAPRLLLPAATALLIVAAGCAASGAPSGTPRRTVAATAPADASVPTAAAVTTEPSTPASTAPPTAPPTAASSTSSPPPTSTPPPKSVPTTAPTTSAVPSTAAPTTTSGPGDLPQTDALPAADTPAFEREVSALWAGVVAGASAPALPAFFPEQAYAQLKQIPDAEGDWDDRLVADYSLDLAAAHELLGADPREAELLGVDVPTSYAHWVPPGVCYNSVGYYEVPNSRLVYREGGVVRSFGIASMISWRGTWYVVHLGAVLRSGYGGVVDDPELGAGTPAYSSTC